MAENATASPNPGCAPGIPAISSNSGGKRPSVSTIAARRLAAMNAKSTTKMRAISATSVRHRHGAEREPLACRELLGRALELPARRQDVAPARRAYRRGVAGVEHDLGKSL